MNSAVEICVVRGERRTVRPYVLASGDFTQWGGMDKANYELAWYIADTLRHPVILVAHRVAPPLADHPLVSWRPVARPLGLHALGAPALARAGSRARREGFLIANGGNCAAADVAWVHAVHAAWEPHVARAPLAFRARAAVQKQRARRAEARAVRRARLVITNSNRARQQLIERVGVSPSTVATVYYGNDPAVFRPPSAEERRSARAALGWPLERPVAVFIGALGHDRTKGFDVLFAAWQQLLFERAWDVDLVAFGAGADARIWRDQAMARGLADQVRIAGFSQDVRTVLHAADALVSPTRYDAYGLAVHEALCCGVPAFVTRCAGVAERYPPELDILLLDDPPAAADLTCRLREWRANMPAVQQRVSAFAETFRRRTWSDMGREIIALLQ